MAIPGWTGQRNLAVILASFDDQVSPAAWTAQEQQRFFVGLRDYIATASYGRALLSGSVIGPYSIGNSATFGGNYGPAICAALKAAKADPNADLTSFDAVCVVFNSAGGAGFAYFGQDTCFIGSPFHTGTCWVEQNTPAGTIAHENLHAIAGVGDLYGTWNAPAQWDIMDCACGTHPSAFTKLQLRWLDPADTTTFEPNKARGFAGIGIGGGRVTLRALELPPQRGSASAVIIRLDQSRIYSLELRQRLDAYDSSQPLKPGIPDEGVLISYIEENQGAARPVHVRRLLKAGERFANMTEHVLTVACESITQGSAAIGVAYQAQIFSFWPPPPKVLPQLAAFFAVEALALAQLGGYTIPSRNTYDQFVQFNSAVGQDPQTVTADLIDRFKLQFDRQWQRSSENGASFYANTSVRWAANGVNTGDRDPLDFSVLNQSSSPDWRLHHDAALTNPSGAKGWLEDHLRAFVLFFAEEQRNFLCALFTSEAVWLAGVGGYQEPARNSTDPGVHFRWAWPHSISTIRDELIDRYSKQLDSWGAAFRAPSTLYSRIALRLNALGVSFGSADANSLDASVHSTWANRVGLAGMKNETARRVNVIFAALA